MRKKLLLLALGILSTAAFGVEENVEQRVEEHGSFTENFRGIVIEEEEELVKDNLKNEKIIYSTIISEMKKKETETARKKTATGSILTGFEAEKIDDWYKVKHVLVAGGLKGENWGNWSLGYYAAREIQKGEPQVGKDNIIIETLAIYDKQTEWGSKGINFKYAHESADARDAYYVEPKFSYKINDNFGTYGRLYVGYEHKGYGAECSDNGRTYGGANLSDYALVEFEIGITRVLGNGKYIGLGLQGKPWAEIKSSAGYDGGTESEYILKPYYGFKINPKTSIHIYGELKSFEQKDKNVAGNYTESAYRLGVIGGYQLTPNWRIGGEIYAEPKNWEDNKNEIENSGNEVLYFVAGNISYSF